MVAGSGKKFISPQPTGYALKLKIIFARLRVKYQKLKRILLGIHSLASHLQLSS